MVEPRNCANCQVEFTPPNTRRGQECCSRPCADAIRGDKLKKRETRACLVCETMFEARPSDTKTCCSPRCAASLRPQNQENPLVPRTCIVCQGTFHVKAFHKQKTCSTECQMVRHATSMSERWTTSPTLRASNREYMTTRNPMFYAEVRQKAGESIKRTGRFDHLTGGNGHVSPTEELLFSKLGSEWELSHTVPMGKGSRAQGLPGGYKIDLAYPELKLGIELDGNSHGTLKQKEKDRKKEFALKERGWEIRRFKNEVVRESLDGVLAEIDKWVSLRRVA